MAIYINGTKCTVGGTTTITPSSSSEKSFTIKTDAVIGGTLRVEFSDYDTVKSSSQGTTNTYIDYETYNGTISDTVTCDSAIAGKTLNLWQYGLWDSPYAIVKFAVPPSISWQNYSVSQQNNGTVLVKMQAAGYNGSGNITYKLTVNGSTTTLTGASGAQITKTYDINSNLSYNKAYTFSVTASYSTATPASLSQSKTFYLPSISPPSQLVSSESIGRSTVLTWKAASLRYATSTSGITYIVYNRSEKIGETKSLSYDVSYDIASKFDPPSAIFTIVATVTNLSNTDAGQTLTSSASNEALFEYVWMSKCTPPIEFYLEQDYSYVPVNLVWSGAKNGIGNEITGYLIQYQDSLDNISWPETWIDCDFTVGTALQVDPPEQLGAYRRFRIQTQTNYEDVYFSDWLICSNSLQKGMKAFTGFTDDILIQRKTKIKAIHFTEMQTLINNLRVLKNLEPISFTDIHSNTTKISDWKQHVKEIRDAVDQMWEHDEWLDLSGAFPSVSIMEQLRNSIVGYSHITISITAERKIPQDCVITVVNMKDQSVLAQFEYHGLTTVKIMPDTMYQIICSNSDQYTSAPVSAIMTAVRNDKKHIELHYRDAKRYGFRREKAVSNSNNRITYLYDARGMNPLSVDTTTGAVNYGDWQEFIDEICRPVMLKYDGTVDYELDHADQSLKIDGSSSDISNSDYPGNAMVEFRRYKWVKRYEDTYYEYVIFSDAKYDETYNAYAHTNSLGDIQDAFYWAMFKGSTVSNKIRSLGNRPATASQTASAEITQATANGDGWYIGYKSGWDYICDLLTLLSKSDNSQASFGTGRCSTSNTAPIDMGTLISKPAFCGYKDKTSDVKVLYIEGLWGNIRERLAGIILNAANGLYVKMTPPYNTDGTGYLNTGIILSGTSGKFTVQTSSTDKYGYLPKTIGGSASTYMCDSVWYSTAAKYYASVGGGYAQDTGCGYRSMNFTQQDSAVETFLNSRLSYIHI